MNGVGMTKEQSMELIVSIGWDLVGCTCCTLQGPIHLLGKKLLNPPCACNKCTSITADYHLEYIRALVLDLCNNYAMNLVNIKSGACLSNPQEDLSDLLNHIRV